MSQTERNIIGSFLVEMIVGETLGRAHRTVASHDLRGNVCTTGLLLQPLVLT